MFRVVQRDGSHLQHSITHLQLFLRELTSALSLSRSVSLCLALSPLGSLPRTAVCSVQRGRLCSTFFCISAFCSVTEDVCLCVNSHTLLLCNYNRADAAHTALELTLILLQFIIIRESSVLFSLVTSAVKCSTQDSKSVCSTQL